MPSLDWNKMLDRQAACKSFLTYLINNPTERDDALDDPAKARAIFEREGGMTLPAEVKITAVADTRPERDNFNVIMVPSYDPDPDPLRYWLAAWVPYASKQP